MANIYKVGNKVRVRTDLSVTLDYGGQSVTSDMIEYAGKVVTIRHVSDDLYDMSSCYMIEGSTWGWTNEMFIPLDIDADKAFSMLVNDELSEESYKQIIES